MNRFLVFVIAFVFVVLSCRKDSGTADPAGSGKKYAVKLQVAPFNQQVTPLSAHHGKISAAPEEEPSLADYVDKVSFFVYDEAGKLVLEETQLRDSVSNFGLFSDSLATGNYTVVALGYLRSNTSKNYQPRVEGNSLSTAALNFDSLRTSRWGLGDVFFKKVKLNVQGEDITQPLVLERVVGRLVLDIGDDINLGKNADYYSVTLMIDGEYNSFLFDSETAGNPAKGPVSLAAFEFGNIVLNTSTPFSVTLLCYDVNGILRAKKTVNNVRCYKNKVTRLSGDVFTPESPNSGFTFTVDDKWGTDSTEVNF